MTVVVLLALLALIGAPLFALIATAALIGFDGSGSDLSVVVIEFYRLAEMPVLISVPLFAFAGYLLGESDAPARLLRLTRVVIGWLPGGFAIVALAVCAFFTAFTGASGVTIIALGALLYPALRSAGYPERFSLGLVTTSGSLGVLFAPALPLILYGIVAQQMEAGRTATIERLFVAGLLPGLLMVVALALWSFTVGRRAAIPLTRFTWRELRVAVRESAWELPLPLFVFGGIYGGWFAVSEAAAVTALYVLVVEVIIHREIPVRALPTIMRDAMLLVGGVLIVLGMSLAFMSWLIDAEVPARLFEVVRARVSDPVTFLLLLNVFLLALGMLLDIFSALVLMVPLILPLAVHYGVDPVHLGIVFLANMQIGYFTPPVGMNLFIASLRFDRPIVELTRACLPYFLILFACVLIITFWPALSLGLL